MKEFWKVIGGYENYEISTLGRVKSISRTIIGGNGAILKTKDIILKPGITKKGYRFVSLSKNNKSKVFKVHRLVALHFKPLIPNKNIVCHKIPVLKGGDDSVENVYWGDTYDNNKDTYSQSGKELPFGVYFSNDKYVTQIYNGTKTIALGNFNSAKEAEDAYNTALMKKKNNIPILGKKESGGCSSMVVGVTFSKRYSRYLARITINGKRKQIGLFYTEHEADLAIIDFKKKLNNNEHQPLYTKGQDL